MDVKINSLVPLERVKSDADYVLDLVDENGKVVLLEDNKPAYIILKYDIAKGVIDKVNETEKAKYTLHEAMKIVLSENRNLTMHAAALADEIYNRGLYRQKNGDKAQYNQIRARCGHYPELFEALPGNMIKLKKVPEEMLPSFLRRGGENHAKY